MSNINNVNGSVETQNVIGTIKSIKTVGDVTTITANAQVQSCSVKGKLGIKQIVENNYEKLSNLPKVNGVELIGNLLTRHLKLIYNELLNLPKINGVELAGDLTTEDLKIEASNDYNDSENKPKINDVELKGNLTTAELKLMYEKLLNLPKINGVELIGDKTTEDLGIEASGGTIKDVKVNNSSVVNENGVAEVNVPIKVSQLQNDSGFLTQLTTALVYYYTKTEIDNKIKALPLGTIINIIDTFNYSKRFNNDDIYNANAVNSSVDWIILAILEAFNREVLVDINVQINPITFQIISIDKSFSDIVNAFELGGTTRVVAQLAGTSTKVILQLALLDSGVASFTTVMKANLGQGEMKYLLGINIAERYQNVIIDVLS